MINWYLKRYSPSLITKEMHMKTTLATIVPMRLAKIKKKRTIISSSARVWGNSLSP